jgi:hypothetical protein
VHVDKALWKHQVVRYMGRKYYLTRLGFGLNAALKILLSIVKSVLSSDPIIQEASDHYYDDIIVKVDEVPVVDVMLHLQRFGLETKPPEIIDNARVLGLQVYRADDGVLYWKRGNKVPSEPTELSRRELFSICGKLLGHFPVARWLRLACSCIKRMADGNKWDDLVGPETTMRLHEHLAKVSSGDPVGGTWNGPADDQPMTVWCDANNIGIGVVLESGSRRLKDAAWLRKGNDYAHINVAELDAVIKGVNLAIRWKAKTLTVITDSVTVWKWLKSARSRLATGPTKCRE